MEENSSESWAELRYWIVRTVEQLVKDQIELKEQLAKQQLDQAVLKTKVILYGAMSSATVAFLIWLVQYLIADKK